MSTGRTAEAGRNWPRIVGEGAAIVVSILLAFAIDAWWEERGLRIEEQKVLQGLHEEFGYIHQVLSGHYEAHLADVQILEDFLVAAESDVPPVDAGPIVDAVVVELLNPMTSDLGSGTLDALLSSGRIEILRNRTLRAKLASWEGVINEVWDDQILHVRAIFEIHIPYFLASDIPAGSAMRQWYEDWPAASKLPSDDPAVVSRLLRDKGLREMVAIRYGYKRHGTEEFEIALAAVDDILAEIEKSLD